MPWSDAFIARMSSRRARPRFLLESIVGTDFQPGIGNLAISSHLMPGYIQALGDGGRVNAGQISIGDWSSTVSEVSLPFRGAYDVRRYVTRGQPVQLRIGWAGWSADQYEIAFSGHVQQITRSGDHWQVSIRSVVQSLVSKMSGAPLFDGLGESTLALGYTAGAVSLTVASAASAGRETGGGWLLQVFPSAGGDPFLIRATALVGATFTVETSAILGTTATNALIGDRVVFTAYIYDDPVRVALKVITSTGLGTNGSQDTLPFSWGVGIPSGVLDLDDIDWTRLSVAGTSNWDVFSTEEQDDGLAWLQSVLSPAGLVLVERQGCLTIRGVSAANVRPYDVEVLTDDDLISVDDHQSWDTASPVEASSAIVVSHPGETAGGAILGTLATQTETLDTRPATGQRFYHLTYVDQNEADTCGDVLERVAPWVLRVPEVVTMTCRGLRLAKLAACDSIEMQSRHFRTRDRAEGPTLMVLKVEPDWWRGTVKIIAAYHPPTATEF